MEFQCGLSYGVVAFSWRGRRHVPGTGHADWRLAWVASGWPLVALFGVSLKRVLEAAGRAALMSGSMSCFQSSKVPWFKVFGILPSTETLDHFLNHSAIRP